MVGNHISTLPHLTCDGRAQGSRYESVASTAIDGAASSVQLLCKSLLVEIKLEIAGFPFNLAGVCVFKIGLDDVVPVLSYSP